MEVDLAKEPMLAATHQQLADALVEAKSYSTSLPVECAKAVSSFNAKRGRAKARGTKHGEVLRILAAELALVMLKRVESASDRVTQLLDALKDVADGKAGSAAVNAYVAKFLIRALCITTPANVMAIVQAQTAADSIRRFGFAERELQALLVPLAVLASMGSDTAALPSEQVSITRYVVARCINTQAGKRRADPALSGEALGLAKNIATQVFDKLECRTMGADSACNSMHPATGAARDWASGAPDDNTEQRARELRDSAVASAQLLLFSQSSRGSAPPGALAAVPTTSSGQGVALVGRAAAMLGGKSLSQFLLASVVGAPCPPDVDNVMLSVINHFSDEVECAFQHPGALPHLDECGTYCVPSLAGAKEARAEFLAWKKGLSHKEQQAAVDPIAGTWAEDMVNIASSSAPDSTKVPAFKQAQAAAAVLGLVSGNALGCVDMRVSIANSAIVAGELLRAASPTAAGANTAALRKILSKSSAFVVEPSGDFARLVGHTATASKDWKTRLLSPCEPLPPQGFSSPLRAAQVGNLVAILACQLAAALDGEAVAPVVEMSTVNRLLESPLSLGQVKCELQGLFGHGLSEAEAMTKAGWVSVGGGKWRARTDADEAPLLPQEKQEAADKAAKEAAKAAKEAVAKEAAAAVAARKQAAATRGGGTKQASTSTEKREGEAAAAATAEDEEEDDEGVVHEDEDEDEDGGNVGRGAFLALCPDGCMEFARRRLQAHVAETLAAANREFKRKGGEVAEERTLELPELSFAAIAELIVSSAGPTALGLAVLGRGEVTALPDRSVASRLAATMGKAEPAAMQALIAPVTPDGFALTAKGLSRKSAHLPKTKARTQQGVETLEAQIQLKELALLLDEDDGHATTDAASGTATGAAAGPVTDGEGPSLAATGTRTGSLSRAITQVDAGFDASLAGEAGDRGDLDGEVASAGSVWSARPKLRVLRRLATDKKGDAALFLARPPALRLTGVVPMIAAATSLCAASTAMDVDVGQVIVEAAIGAGGSAVPALAERRLVETCMDATAAMLTNPPAAPGSIGLRWTLATGDGAAAYPKVELLSLKRAKQESCAFVNGRLQKVSLSQRATVAMAASAKDEGVKKAPADEARKNCSPAGPCCPS
ncbi:hypothetical protein FNF29_07238 [Cafeteria roenbergensis]|uniref:Uncharacterized protein n=1 Tax=Cafeteria roenbergensis TaxID=33653 RepID=A0A5A8C6V7_CAFRO|nr:hypothetical protein FNF29_07238 [Cafeteria roenbergensis]|eukprot:KAA0147591.1 hypothetical protein FNF29_07238 [Cafeteria roenbergensis]